MKKTTRLQNQTGAAVVEFAILLFLVLILLAGIFEFGFLWLQNNYIANAAREGARVAAKAESTPTDVQDAVKDYLRGIYSDSLVADCCDTDNFLAIVYDPDAYPSVDADGTTVYTREVTVTVQTARIWDPLLWNLINIRPFRNTGAEPQSDITQISEIAVFPKEDQTPPGT
jgi:Flp pilus assembly protein TadG